LFHLIAVYDRSEKMPTKLRPLELQVRKTISEFNMLAPGDRVIVAVSGGADSIALLLCLSRLATEFNLSLVVGHLNHRIRGNEGDSDQEFVRQISSNLGIPFFSETIEVKKQATERKENLEQLARQVRYEFLHKTASALNAQKIAVGHTLNDQAETVLFRFLRGSGIQGLSAIHPIVGGIVIRPLLGCTRAGILGYLKQQGAAFREDSTNKDLCHTRNRIRQELLPSLEKQYNPQLIHTLGRMAGLARENWSFIRSEAKKIYTAIHQKVDEDISLPVAEIGGLHPALQKQVLRCALESCSGSLSGVTSQHINSLLSLCGKKSGSRILLPNRMAAIRQFDKVLILKSKPLLIKEFSYTLAIPGQCLVPETGGLLIAQICEESAKDLKRDSKNKAFFELAVLPDALTVRSRTPGDRYGGLGHRKVKKMLIDRKIPLAQRLILPMVVAGRDVIWIPGFRPARDYEARSVSGKCVMLEFKENSKPDAQKVKELFID
jgi:tRNA(Ile)-lysidine synthase